MIFAARDIKIGNFQKAIDKQPGQRYYIHTVYYVIALKR